MDELKEKLNIENMIYEIRGKQVILTQDVAKLYEVETKVLNQTIKRNINRFPEEFCFQITNEELTTLCLRSQFVTLNKRGQHYKYLPYVLTEQGIMMLSGLLKSDVAVSINVKIIDAFVKLRKFISNNLIEQKFINELVIKDNKRIDLLEKSFFKLEEREKINTIFIDGQIYDAYSLLMDILCTAKKEIIIIDNYANKEILDILKNIDIKIIIVSSNIDEILKNKYEKQYNNIEFKNISIFHDRFIIIDNNKLYSCGASFKDLGKKCFAINEMNYRELITNLVQKININEN